MARSTSTTVPAAALRPLATLRPHGIGRFCVAAFLMVWLSGWAAGEVTVLGIVGAGIGAALGLLPDEHLTRFAFEGNIWFGVAFIGVWLTLWTMGGVGALAMLGRLLFGVDDVQLGVSELVVRSGVGPWRRERRVACSRIFSIEHVDGDVVATLVGERWRVSTLGTADEREALVAAIRAGLGERTTSLDVARVDEVPAPFAVSERAGEVRLLQQVRAWPLAVVMACVVLCCALSLLRAARLDAYDDVVAAGIVVALAAVVLVLAARPRAVGFVVRGTRLYERTGLLRVRERELTGALVVRRHVDSEGDERFELCAGPEVLLRNTSAACLHLGHHLAARTSTRLRESES